MIITLKMLTDNDACASQVRLFKRRYGKSVRVTQKGCLAVAQVFSWGWAGRYLLSAPASKAYNEAIAAASKAYDEARAQASKAYDEAVAPARKAYDEAVAPARKAYNEAQALAFANAANGRIR